jgi:hypothetical protein
MANRKPMTVDQILANAERAVAGLAPDSKRTTLPGWINWFAKRVARNAQRDGREIIKRKDVSEAEDALIRKGIDWSLEGLGNAIRHGEFKAEF